MTYERRAPGSVKLGFEKLLIFATTLDSKNEVEQYTTGVQTQMLVRLAVSPHISLK